MKKRMHMRIEDNPITDSSPDYNHSIKGKSKQEYTIHVGFVVERIELEGSETWRGEEHEKAKQREVPTQVRNHVANTFANILRQ